MARDRTASERRRAVALAYDASDVTQRRAPRVVAKGQGLVAEQILERARAAGVPINRSPELAALLGEVALDQSVPPALYLAVAELLAWVYRLEARGGGAP
jgi:flagellar biosynthesis protein